jgi:TonB-linked SusC/RagA family outer membrane protein
MKKSLLLLFLSCLFMSAQVMAQMTVTGKVSDDDGEALIGVNIVEKGTTNGTVTDLDGNYSIRVADGATLVFSYVGFETIELLADAASMDVTMTDANILEEVVVTGLNIAKEERAITSSTQQLDGSAFTQAREQNIVNSLSGQIAGVQVTNSSGAVGSSSRLVLRGVTTLSGDNQPLYVVDGVPLDNRSYSAAGSSGGFDRPNGIADLNPDDIASVNILKGPKAAALYGGRAANGVVMITTKDGSAAKKRLGVSFNLTTTFKTPLVIPDFQNSYGQGDNKDFFEWVDGTTGNGGVDESWGPPLDVGLEFVQWNSYIIPGDNSMLNPNPQPLPWVSQPDNVRDFYETGVETSENIAFEGATDNMSYRLSIGHGFEKGIMPNTDYNKYTVAAANTFNVTDKFRTSININYTKGVSGNLPTGGYTNENFVQQTIWFGRNVDLSLHKDWENLPLSPEGTAAEGTPLNWNTVYQNNPYWVLDNNLNKMDKDRVLGSIGLTYDFTDFLSLNVSTGIDYYTVFYNVRKAIGTNEFQDGYYNEEYRRFFQQNSNALLTFDKGFADDDFRVSASVGGNLMRERRNLLFNELASGIELPNLYNLSNAKAGTSASITQTRSNQNINSIFGLVEFSWRRALFVDASVRTDWFSVLPDENNNVTYPSVGAGIVFSEFIPKNDWLTWLKVRGSWARTGSIGALPPYRTVQTFAFRPDNWGSTLLTFDPNTLNNPNLVPESTDGYEIGADLRLFKNRLTVDVTYYNQVSKDLLISVAVPAPSGYLFAWDNIGEIENKGVELQVDATLYKNTKKDLEIGLNFNWAKNKNTVLEVDGTDEGSIILGGQWDMQLQARAGEPYGVIVGHKFERAPDGQIIYEDGLPIQDPETDIVGDIQPDWTGGVGVSLNWKGLSVSTLFDMKIGGDVHSMSYTWGRYAGTLSETLIGRETGIIAEGVKNIGTSTEPVYVPNDVVVNAKLYNQSTFDNNFTEGATFDASYVKWRQLVVGYTLPKKLFENTVLDEITIAFVGRNLAILHKNAPHIDPETAFSSDEGEQGQEFGMIPSTRNLGFNVGIKF